MAENKQEEKKQEEVKIDPYKEKAISMGWKEDWDGAEEDFIDAKEFIRRQPLFDKIAENKRQNQALANDLKLVKDSLNQLAVHHQNVKEVEYQKALKEIRMEKRAALKEGDTTKALELEDKMDEIAEEHKKEVVEIKQQSKEQQQQGVSQQFLIWVKDNDWYLKDEDMHDFADGAAAAYIQRQKIKGIQITEPEVFEYVLEKVKKGYPEKFENPNRQRGSSVASGDRGGKPVKGTYKLSEEEEMIARNFEKLGIMTKDEYAKERKAMQQGDE